MKAVLESHGGVDYLTFRPKGLPVLQIPVITKGSRDKSNAWTWNGDLEKPTIRPSIKTQYTKNGNTVIVHYWLNDGLCKCLGDCTDGNEGQILELLDESEHFNH